VSRCVQTGDLTAQMAALSEEDEGLGPVQGDRAAPQKAFWESPECRGLPLDLT
jgi:hypothetical protein